MDICNHETGGVRDFFPFSICVLFIPFCVQFFRCHSAQAKLALNLFAQVRHVMGT